MAVLNLSNPIFHMDDPATGGPLVGGLVYTYVAGTSTELTTYTDSSLGTSNANPVVLNAYGDAPIWFDQSMKIVVRSADALTTYYTFDNISPVGGTTTVTGNYNLVLNGSFESGTASDVSNWTLTPYSGATIEVDTTNVRHGLQSLKFDGLTGVGGGTASSGKFDVNAGGNLLVSLSTMASNATTTNDVQIFWFQKDDTTPSSTVSTTLGLPAEGSYPTTMTGYTFMASIPADATRAYIKLTGIDSGGSNLDADCWFENIVATENGIYPAAFGTVQAEKAVTADSNGDVTVPATYKVFFTNGSVVCGFGTNSGADHYMYDFTTPRYVFSYSASGNTFTITPPVVASGGVIGDLTGNVTGSLARRGALVYNTTNQSIAHNTATAVTFNSETYDTDSIHDTVTNNTRLTVPSGVTKVQLRAQIGMQASATHRSMEIYKNGYATTDPTFGHRGGCLVGIVGDATYASDLNGGTAILNVSPGDYFEVFVLQQSGGNLTIYATQNWFSMEIIEYA